MKRRLTRLTALAALCAALAGCGIRTTSVPVDAGAAPSRVPCELSAQEPAGEAASGVPLQVYLVCGAQLVSVDRTVRIPEERLSDRVRVAQTLLDELKKAPSDEERQAGFSTDVRESLTVAGARKGDPRDALRLSSQPEDLPTHALAQIVCTYADSAAAGPDRSVTLGGPSDDPVRGYQCTAALKARPESVLPTLGEIRPTR
ncbi:hypothetical protein [Streptomyces chryseus]|uniref:Lipoprotein n=1 Tax=Streptomyces chryseus TaxID=68186 RepID=A0ABQ3DLM8_9ACTN|nr:hypothetical protein [Streptomyces chryseus]GGX24332.1 lipoprotein [Streptomyces chryseus]GHB04154.1 lipoprotein [Streptomyces chryseus]